MHGHVGRVTPRVDPFPGVLGVVDVTVDVDPGSGRLGNVDRLGGSFLGTQPPGENSAAAAACAMVSCVAMSVSGSA